MIIEIINITTMQNQSNITNSILAKIGMNLHMKKNHPIEIIKTKIYDFFGDEYEKFDNFSPIVSIEDNFDKLLIPLNHPARSKSDTYYMDEKTVLRTHTSAHQNSLLTKGHEKFLVTGDVYRKDEIDRNHYPIFHQLEGVCITEPGQNVQEKLKAVLVKLIQYLFPNCTYRFNNDYFPFTDPSYEIEIEFNGKWLEVLGCGVVQPKILENCGLGGKKAWAFGLGLERLAMVLFEIPDIRYFWTSDIEFTNQFASGQIVKFKPYSTLASLTKDISFWISNNSLVDNIWINENDFFELCREVGGDMIEKVDFFDKFYHSKKQQQSRAYHIIYSCPDTSLKNPSEFNLMVNNLHKTIASTIEKNLFVIVR
jgi:phenylalanyl-tRNA synthetase alpha chain